MAYRKSNNFTTISYDQLGTILLLLQTNRPAMAAQLELPEYLVTWLTTCYDEWSNKWVLSGIESGEQNVAFENFQMKFVLLRELLIMIRELLEALVRDTENGQDIMVQYGFDGPTPINRERISKLIKQIKDTSDRLRTAGDPRVIAESIITKLVDANTEVTGLWMTTQAESEDADKTFDELHALYKEAGQKLGLIHKYAKLVLGPYSPELQLLGFAPETPPQGHGQPDILEDFSYESNPPDLKIRWSPSDGATSYQLIYAPDGDNFEELYSGSETQFIYQPTPGTWTYKARARNAHGFSEFCAPLEFTVSEVPA